MKHYANKPFFLFDLDNTLSESKTSIDAEMARLLARLLVFKKIGIISGGSFSQFQKQLLPCLPDDQQLLQALYIFPTCGAALYTNKNGAWRNVYEELLTKNEVKKILQSFETVLTGQNFKPNDVYGDIFENRGTQITFSALGQLAPLKAKKIWDPDCKKRVRIKQTLQKYLPDFEIRIGGTTSIDITKKGIDKGYGITQIKKYIHVPASDILFFGDALFKGGNDYPIKKMGVASVAVSGPEDTKRALKSLLQFID